MARYYPKKNQPKQLEDQTRAMTDFERVLLGYTPRESNYISDDPWTIPAFFNAVREVASAVARTDCWVRKLLPNGAKEDDKNHPAYWLLSWKANEFTTYFDWFRIIITNAIARGDGYSFIDRDEAGNPLGLYNLDSQHTYTITEFTNGRISSVFYGVNTDKGQVIIPADDVVHIRNLATGAGGESLSAFDMMKMAVKKANAIQKFQYLYFKNGSHIAKVVKVPGWLTPEQQEDIKGSLAHLNQGISNAHRLAILQGGTDITSLNLNAQDMELSAIAEATLTDIANIVGIPGTRIGARGSISYGSLEQDNLLFAQNLDNWYTNLEAELTVKLLRPRQQGMTHVIEFDRGSFLAADPGYQRLQLEKYAAKVISIEEVRAKLGEAGEFEPEPEPQPVVVQAQAPNAEENPSEDDSAETPAQETTRGLEAINNMLRAQLKTAGEFTPHKGKGFQLCCNILTRVKKRIVKAVEAGKYDLSQHHGIIREELRGLDCEPVIEHLNTMQAELDAVLPEQRLGIIKQWNQNQTALKIWN